MNTIYSKENFRIYNVDDAFIVHNVNKTFKEGHTHLDSFKSSKYVIDLAIYKDIPNKLDMYRLISLVRISEDEEYISKVQNLIDIKKDRKKGNQPYINRGERCCIRR